MNAYSRIQRNKDLAFTRLDDALLAIDAQSGYCYSLNPTAGRIWDVAQSAVTVQEVVAGLCREYRVDEETCRSEVLRFVEEMRDAGLLKVSDAADSATPS